MNRSCAARSFVTASQRSMVGLERCVNASSGLGTKHRHTAVTATPSQSALGNRHRHSHTIVPARTFFLRSSRYSCERSLSEGRWLFLACRHFDHVLHDTNVRLRGEAALATLATLPAATHGQHDCKKDDGGDDHDPAEGQSPDGRLGEDHGIGVQEACCAIAVGRRR